MEENKIQQLARYELNSDERRDKNAPFSLLEWSKQVPLIQEKDLKYHYNKYLIDWFAAKNVNTAESKKLFLRQKYIYFLEQLQLFFESEEKNKWYNYVNLADEKELLLAIPYFAKKLKNITLYYLKLRNSIKNTKIKYNLKGSGFGLKKQVTEILLDTFTNKNLELPVGIKVPDFETLKDNLRVEVEEIYDDHQYFDRSTTQPLSTYFNLLDEATAKFYATKNIDLSTADWIFTSFNIPLSSNYDTFTESITSALLQEDATQLDDYINFVQKYISEAQSIMDFSESNSVSSTDYTINIQEGNNFFYYPYGTVDFSIKEPTQMNIVALSSINVLTENGTAGTTLEDSDTLFVKIGSDIQGAWLRYVESQTTPKTFKCNIKKDATTSFIYPFPGYGLSGIDIPWTGSSFEANVEYDFLAKNVKSGIQDLYWGQTLPKDSCSSLSINDSELVNQSATSNTNIHFADQVFVRTERNPDINQAQGEVQGAWLYKFTKTAIPISPNQENRFVWPYQAYAAENLPSQLRHINPEDVCDPIDLQKLTKARFIAGDKFQNADKIYRLSHPDDSIEKAVEVAWLSGQSYTVVHDTDEAKTLYGDNTMYFDLSTVYVSQLGFNALFESGKATRFIWGGPRLNLNSVFKHVPHAKDCPYVSNVPPLSSQYDWSKCSCKSTYHSPIGHSYQNLEAGNYQADVIVECTKTELDEFDFGSWKDRFGKFKNESRKFAWFRTRKTQGTNPGKWVSNITNSDGGVVAFPPFELVPGKMYLYRRAVAGEDTPPYSISYTYEGGNAKWMSAKYVAGVGWTDGITSGASTPSQMSLHAGSFFYYDRKTSTTNYLVSSAEVEVQNENRGSAWSTFDYMPLKCAGGDVNSTTISWPTRGKPLDYDLKYSKQEPAKGYNSQGELIPNTNGWTENDVNNQWPVEPIEDVKVTKWVITRLPDDQTNNQTLTEEVEGTQSFAFSPKFTGIYEIAVYYTVLRRTENQQANTATATSADTGKVVNTDYTSYTFDETFYQSRYPLEGNVLIENKDSLTFKAAFLNKRNSSVTGENQNLLYTIIPSITVVPPTTLSPELLPVETTSNAFLIECPLKGWNYNAKVFNKNNLSNVSSGAKPYWATINVEKNIDTKFKGLPVAGYSNSYIDGYLPDHAPRYSDLTINYGQVVEYHRRGSSCIWEQPIDYKQYIGKAQWCKIYNNNKTLSNLNKIYDIKSTTDSLAVPLTAPSDIQLSNIINGSPVEVYYNALNPFVWTSTLKTEIQTEVIPTSYITPAEQTSNLSNRFFPSIATLPVAENLYTIEDVGGYFLPQHLGAACFYNKNFKTTLKNKELNGTYVVETEPTYVGGRGQTKQDQESIYSWKEDNEWMREPVSMNNLFGAPKKSLTKPLQTFVPYYSNDNLDSLGLLSKKTKFTPWGGTNNEQWVDQSYRPDGFTGQIDIDSWKNKQIANFFKADDEIEGLCSDIYGNQYGIFKASDTTTGELWVRDCGQNIDKAEVLLPNVFTIVKGLKNSFSFVETFYNILILRNTSSLFFFGLDQDYINNKIIITSDLYKQLPVQDNKYEFQQTLQLTSEKTLVTLFFEYNEDSGGKLWSPALYAVKYNEEDLVLNKIFILNDTDQKYLRTKIEGQIGSLSNIDFSKGIIKYREQTNEYTICCSGSFGESKNRLFIIDITIENKPILTVTKINLYF